MRVLLAACCVLACTHRYKDPAEATEAGKAWARDNPQTIPFHDECLWDAQLRNGFWIVSERENPHSGVVGTDCYCHWDVFINARTNEPVCAMCGGGFAIDSIAYPGSCEQFYGLYAR